LLHDESASSGLYAHTVSINSVFQGFAITGINTVVQNIIHLKDAVNVTFRDVGVDGAGAAGSACIWLHDVNYWTERNTFENVSTIYGCKIGWRFTADVASPYQPNPSFGYNRFLNIKANPITGQQAFSMEGNSYIYNCTFRMTVNADHATIIHMQDNARYYENETHMFGEGASNITLELQNTSQFTYNGQINVGPQVNSIAGGAILIHWGDDGGYGPATSTVFYNNVIVPGLSAAVYTVATLPAASSVRAGTQVVVSDATTFTPGTCTGGGSDYMIAVSNTATWSCH